MDSTDTERALSTGKPREDRGAQLKHRFDALHLEIKYPGTAILLLQCQESPALLAAAAALAKFGTKSYENLQILFDLEIVKSVIPLIEHNDIFTRRFAAKLLAEMTAIPSVKKFLMESDYYVPHFVKVLINERDTFMQEFSSLILAEMSKDMYGVAQLLKHCPDLNFLFERIQSPDPDVKKNNIEIMYNLMQDLTGARRIVEAEDFSLSLIYQLFQQPYPEIQQLALSVIADFVCRSKDDHIQHLFRQSKGLEALLSILDNDPSHELHSQVLKILCMACDNIETVEMLEAIGGIQRIFQYMQGMPNSKLFLESFDVVVRLTNTPVGRKALYSYNIVEHLLNTLRPGMQPEIYRISCYGIGRMALHAMAAKDLPRDYTINSILGILINESWKWSVRQAAMFALNELLGCNVNNCIDFLQSEGELYLIWLIKQSDEKVPLETRLMAVQALAKIARHPSFRSGLINSDIIDAICTIFQSTSPSADELKIISCEALAILCIDQEGREAFLKNQGPTKLYNLITDINSIPVRYAAVQLIQELCLDLLLASTFVKAKYLSYMLNNRSSTRVIPSWDTCIEALFDAHLPAKFAFTGRLSLHDVTQDGFYVLRKKMTPFPVLSDIFHFKFCPLEPIYVVNAVRTVFVNGMVDEDTIEEARNTITRDSASRGVTLSAESINGWLDLMFGRLQPDCYLCDYIDLLKCKLATIEPKDVTTGEKAGLVNIRYIMSRAEILAKFVARQLSGPDPTSTCIDHQVEVHLKEIREAIGTSVIPIGQLRVGSFLERAVLFKVLADRICLPAALVRGDYGKVWIEIAVPQSEMLEEDTSFNEYLKRNEPCVDWVVRTPSKSLSSFRASSSVIEKLSERNTKKATYTWTIKQSVFPTKLMKPNVVVDLMIEPGRLMLIGSEEANKYCGTVQT